MELLRTIVVTSAQTTLGIVTPLGRAIFMAWLFSIHLGNTYVLAEPSPGSRGTDCSSRAVRSAVGFRSGAPAGPLGFPRGSHCLQPRPGLSLSTRSPAPSPCFCLLPRAAPGRGWSGSRPAPTVAASGRCCVLVVGVALLATPPHFFLPILMRPVITPSCARAPERRGGGGAQQRGGRLSSPQAATPQRAWRGHGQDLPRSSCCLNQRPARLVVLLHDPPRVPRHVPRSLLRREGPLHVDEVAHRVVVEGVLGKLQALRWGAVWGDL